MSMHNSKKRFNYAKMLYEACSLLGWGENPKEVVDKVNQLRRGLPKEDEFVALSIWTGKCSLIHKLDQDQFPSLSREMYQVPDLFGLYDFNGRNVPVLIEIKTTSDMRLEPFSNIYYCKLVNYASLLGLPLLLAWHIERLNVWCLFELERMTKRQTAFHIDFQTAMNNSLLGILLDDVIITLRKGTQLSFKIRKEPGTELRNSTSGVLRRFSGTMEEIVWFNPEGKEIANSLALRQFLDIIFRVVDNDMADSEDNTHVTITFYTTQEENLFAHQLLGVMAFGTAVVGDEKPSWLEVIRDNKFRMDYHSMRSAATEGVKSGVVSRIIRQNPAIFPKFLA